MDELLLKALLEQNENIKLLRDGLQMTYEAEIRLSCVEKICTINSDKLEAILRMQK